ncbi:MAG: hypothetical protein Q4A17_09720 [Thermoguttaceae bacterium]|nr:hypothetical protein [Thermoguttaceae bacterium]
MNRREFIGSIGAAALMSAGITKNTQGGEMAEDAIAQWDRETELVAPEEYKAYLIDGNTRGLVSLEKLEKAFDKVMCEVKETVVTGVVPAVWSVYNMGYIVKTRESLFSIDLFHRRAVEFAPLLDFALITHNHGDHWRQDFYDAMDGAGKTVISNFLENSGAKESGLVHGVKTFKIKDVEIRTSLIDHNPKLINFTTAFEIRIGSFILYHTGDSGRGTEPKLETVWGRPDLWLFFPGCGIDTAVAVKKINAKRIVFGHLWELGHKRGHVGMRLDEPLIRPRLVWAKEAGCEDVSVAFWGDRIL